MLALAAGKSATADSLSSGQVVSFYLATYLIMTLGVFFILAQVRIQRDGEIITDFNGLGKTNPMLALALTVLLAALAGVPLTAGFIGKFFVFSLAVEAQLWVGVGIAFIAAAAGFYYYLNVVRAMWWADPRRSRPAHPATRQQGLRRRSSPSPRSSSASGRSRSSPCCNKPRLKTESESRQPIFVRRTPLLKGAR